MISLKHSVFTAAVLFSVGSFAQGPAKKSQPIKPLEIIAKAEAADDSSDESLMTDRLNLNVGEYVEIKRYDKETKTFQILVVDDPTPEPIYVTPESVVKAIHSLNPRSVKIDPEDIVGSRYNLDEELPVLYDFERAARRKGY